MSLSSIHSARRPYKQALLLAAVAFVAMMAAAQKVPAAKKPYALLYGTVWSVDDRPLAGVKVHIRRSEDKKPRWTLVSDSRGEVAQRVPPGAHDYVVWTELKGRESVETKVHVDNEERVDFGLHLTD